MCVFERGGASEREENITAIIMPARTAVGSRGKKVKEGRRLCLELSMCGSSGPQSLYQCHSSIFSFHLSAQRLFFPPFRARKTLAFSPWMAQHNRLPRTPTYPAHAISSLNITLCLNAILFLFFPSLNPIICRSAEY